MKDARSSAPKICRCGQKLAKPIYDKDKWKVFCDCGSILLWCYPNVWKQGHILELGQTLEAVA